MQISVSCLENRCFFAKYSYVLRTNYCAFGLNFVMFLSCSLIKDLTSTKDKTCNNAGFSPFEECCLTLIR